MSKTTIPSITRREFVASCTKVAAILGLPIISGTEKLMAAVTNDNRPPVIWLHFQECTGDTETLLRASHPDVAKLILELISLDYHETLMAAAGYQAEAALHDTMKKHHGKYIVVVEGSIPVKDGGIYCQVAGKTALSIMKKAAKGAAAIIAFGSCSSYGGPQSVFPNPTGAKGVLDIIKNRPVINIPGCPANPYNFLATILYYLTFNKIPKLDKENRPLFGYGKLLHDHCERRGHFDSGKFVEKWGDEAHQNGWCLYKMGCKGPVTHANCSSQRFCDVGVWPVGSGSPCAGCTERNVAHHIALHEVPLPYTFPAIAKKEERGTAGNVAFGIAGAALGAAAGVAATVAAKLPGKKEEGNVKEDNQ